MSATTLPPTSSASEQERRLSRDAGRELSYLVLGDAGGRDTVVVLDGPGSRGLARAMAPFAAELGIRLVAPDRPGFGGSSVQAGRAIPGWPADHAAILDDLGVAQAGVVGHSGGTPYALAAAGALPTRTSAVALLGAVAPVHGDRAAQRELGRELRSALRLARWAPALLRAGLRASSRRVAKDPAKAAAKLIRVLPPADREQLRDPVLLELHESSSAEILRHPDAIAAEISLLARPWGIDLGAVRAPVALWSGAADRTHPTSHSERLAAALGGAPVEVVPDSATFGLRPRFGDVLRFAAGRQAATG